MSMAATIAAPHVRIRQYVMRLAAVARDEPVPILSENRLSALFGVCRNTVRKALKELVAEGSIVVRPGVGMFATSRNAQAAEEFHPGLKQAMLGIVTGNGRTVHYDYFSARLQQGVLAAIGRTPHFHQFFPLIGRDNDRMLEELRMLRLDGLVWLNPAPNMEPLIGRLSRTLPVVATSWHPLKVPRQVLCRDPLDLAEVTVAYFFARQRRKLALLEKSSTSPWCARLCEGWKAAYRRRRAVFDTKLLLTGDDRLAQLDTLLKFDVGLDGIYASSRYVEQVLEIVKRHAPGLPVLTEESPLNVFSGAVPARLHAPLSEAGKKAVEILLDVLAGRGRGQILVRIPYRLEDEENSELRMQHAEKDGK